MSNDGRIFRIGTFVAALLLTNAVVLAADPLVLPAVRAAVVPQADVVLSVDAAGWNGTAIQKQINDIQDGLAEGEEPPAAMRAWQHVKSRLEVLGIEEEDLHGVIFSADLAPLSAEGRRPQSKAEALQRISSVGCFSLKKSVTISGIRNAINGTAAEEGWDVMFEKGEYQGVPTLTVITTDTDTEDNPISMFGGELYLALVEEGKVGYAGLAPHVKGAVDRYKAKQAAAFAPAIAKAKTVVRKEDLTYALFIPGDDMRAAARDRSVQMQQQNPMMGAALRSVAGMQFLALGMAGSDRIAAQLSADFASPQDAIQIKTLLDMMVISTGKMMIMQALGRPIPLMESLLSQQDGNRVALQAEVTEEDWRALMELRAKAKAKGPGMPPAPPAP